ncbi:MAG: RAMP superfamily CRISPR-associated protein, partial [Gammaproteobacteria bacterium]
MTFLIRTCSPLLVNEPGFVREKQSNKDVRPEHEYSRTPEGKPMIPASTLRGLLRARARRILMT